MFPHQIILKLHFTSTFIHTAIPFHPHHCNNILGDLSASTFTSLYSISTQCQSDPLERRSLRLCLSTQNITVVSILFFFLNSKPSSATLNPIFIDSLTSVLLFDFSPVTQHFLPFLKFAGFPLATSSFIKLIFLGF